MRFVHFVPFDVFDIQARRGARPASRGRPRPGRARAGRVGPRRRGRGGRGGRRGAARGPRGPGAAGGRGAGRGGARRRLSQKTRTSNTRIPTHTHTHARTRTHSTRNNTYCIWKHVRAPWPTRQTGKRMRLCPRHTLPLAPARLAREAARVATERVPLPELHGVIDYKLRFVPDVGIDATHEDVQQPIARHAHLRPR